jgi:hypothetical protein
MDPKIGGRALGTFPTAAVVAEGKVGRRVEGVVTKHSTMLLPSNPPPLIIRTFHSLGIFSHPLEETKFTPGLYLAVNNNANHSAKLFFLNPKK